MNAAGIHVRPSGVIFSELRGESCSITVSANGMTSDLKSVMGLIALGLVQEDQVDVAVEGPGEEAVCAKTIGLFEKLYDFPPRR